MQIEATIATFLTNRKPSGKIDLLRLGAIVRKGIPGKHAFRVKEALRLTNRELADLLGISERTLSRLQKGKGRLSLIAGDRLYRIARVFALARRVLEDDQRAVAWLRRPQFGLGERIPLDLLHTEVGAREVEALLGRMEYSAPA